MFYSKIKALQELQQISHHFAQKKDNPIFGQPMGNVHASLRSYFSTLYPLDTFRYDIVSLSMTIPNLQIAVFLNSHPGLAFGRPVVMAGFRPAMITGGLENSRRDVQGITKWKSQFFTFNPTEKNYFLG